MHSFVLAAVLSIAAARPQLPAGNVNDDRDGDEGDDRDKSCWQSHVKISLIQAWALPNAPTTHSVELLPLLISPSLLSTAPPWPPCSTPPLSRPSTGSRPRYKHAWESAILGQKIKPLLRKWNLIKNLRLPRAQPPSQWQLWMGRMLLLATTRYLREAFKNVLADFVR